MDGLVSRHRSDLAPDLPDLEATRASDGTAQEYTPIPITDPQVAQVSASAQRILLGYGALLFARENRPRIGVATGLTAINIGLHLLTPYLLGEVIQTLSNKDASEDQTFYFITLLVSLVAVNALSQMIPNFRDQIMVPVTANSSKKLIEMSAEHLLKKSLHYHVTTTFSDQFYFIQKGFSVSGMGTPLFTQIAPTLVEILIACTFLSQQYGIGMGAGLLALLASFVVYSKYTTPSVIEAREKMISSGNRAYESLNDALKRYKVMRDCNQLEKTMSAIDSTHTQMASAEIQCMSKPFQISYGYSMISHIHMLAAALPVGLGVLSGRYNVQNFVTLVGYLREISTLLPAFGAAMNQLFTAYPDIKFVFSELSIPDEVVDLHPDTPLLVDADRPPSIEFEGVSFSYPPKAGEPPKPLFEDLTFTIPSGKKVAFVSESGAGKTTIFNLLYGYYAPERGRIKIDGQDISQVSLNSLQRSIRLLGQNPNLFKGSIRENISYGESSEEISDDRIFDLAARAGLFDFLQSFPDKLGTDVGEDGKALSGGQQQKVAVLRGLLKQSSIQLLDEITAPFDSDSASQVLQNVFRTSSKVTTLMITHKLTEAQMADQIVVLEGGRVVAQGPHTDLLSTCPLYQRLWSAYTSHSSEAETLVSSSLM